MPADGNMLTVVFTSQALQELADLLDKHLSQVKEGDGHPPTQLQVTREKLGIILSGLNEGTSATYLLQYLSVKGV